MTDNTYGKKLNKRWQKRFAFFDQHGYANTPEFNAAYRALPFGEKMLISFNLLAFFFGAIYLFILGAWRKNLVLIALSVIITIVYYALADSFISSQHLIEQIGQGINIGLAAIYGTLANRIYYLHVAKGSKSWNPFE